MQIVNDVARRGIVIGWDPLKLGNALSCVATLFLLSRKTGLSTVYPYAGRYAELFSNPGNLSLIHIPRGVDRNKLHAMTERLTGTLETVPNAMKIEGSSFAELASAKVKGVVWFSRHEAYLSDWRTGDAEAAVKAFCRRGNGLVLQGSYWRQYTDMRELAKAGEALRRHLGPLREHRGAGHDDAILASGDVVKIGLHLRLGDYRIWLDGRYFFDVAEYRLVAERLHRALSGRPHVFYIVSDQDIDRTVFADLPVEFSCGDLFEDFIRLSRCDYVVGPPSTFSTWSAFCGGTKRIVLTRERIESEQPLLAAAVDIPFPTGSYVPGDERAGPI